MSTSVPAVADKVRAVAGPGHPVLDAPVAGGITGARDGTLQIFVGGATEDVVRVRPLLEVMGDPERILHVGSYGAGYTVKLMLNLLWFASVTLTAEALTIGVRAGVDVATLRRSLLTSAAASHFLEHDVLSVLERGDFDDSFALALACKDLGLAVDLARQTGVPAEMSAMVEQIYRRARAQYGDAGRADAPHEAARRPHRHAPPPVRTAGVTMLPARRRKVRCSPPCPPRTSARGTVERVPRQCAAPACQAAVIVTDPALAGTPVVAAWWTRWQRRDTGDACSRGVQANPTTDDVAAGADVVAALAAEAGRPAVVAVGGGSADRRGQGHRARRGQPAARPRPRLPPDVRRARAAHRGGADHRGHRGGDERVRGRDRSGGAAQVLRRPRQHAAGRRDPRPGSHRSLPPGATAATGMDALSTRWSPTCPVAPTRGRTASPCRSSG